MKHIETIPLFTTVSRIFCLMAESAAPQGSQNKKIFKAFTPVAYTQDGRQFAAFCILPQKPVSRNPAKENRSHQSHQAASLAFVLNCASIPGQIKISVLVSTGDPDQIASVRILATFYQWLQFQICDVRNFITHQPKIVIELKKYFGNTSTCNIFW